ncbi:MAG: hypothetical protein EP343_01790 [Deltaproteobacteria bacterium]|nr:MAG: hypothetical protein EP343_01790 [Deltaproteobacteria bacterium]
MLMRQFYRAKWYLLALCSLFVIAGAVGCDCGSKPPVNNVDGVVIKDGGGEAVTDAAPTEGSTEQDATCARRCDCPQGQECSAGQCVVPTTPVYCCDRENCPQGVACESNAGQAGVCGLRDQCKQTCDCDQGLACIDGYCTRTNTPVYCCEKSGCVPGQACDSRSGGAGTCGGEGSACVSACDCVSGLACTNGQCTKSSTPVYCCDRQDCPSGQTCETTSGAKGVCGQNLECRSACDCPTGEACSNSKCRKTDLPIYCCDKPESCPAGQACDTKDGQRDKCPVSPGCQQNCDCPQGQFCNNGRCVTGGTQVYCCSKPGCPARAACYNADGSIGNCPGENCTNDASCGKASCVQQGNQCTQTVPRCRDDGSCANEVTSNPGTCDPGVGLCKFAPPQCKTACDCPQTQGCVQGQCQKTIRPVYCCEKQGCPDKEICFKSDGTTGFCPTQPQCKSDVDCGSNTCQQSGNNCINVLPTCGPNGVCTRTSQTVANADCKQGSTGRPACVPRTTPECKTDADCPAATCSQSGNNCIPSTYGCVAGKCVPAPGRVVQNADCRKTSSGAAQCVPRPPQCTIGADCGKVACKDSGTTCFQSEPRCSNGQCTTVSSTINNAKCDSAAGKCIQAPIQCKTPCDCSQGLNCVNNQCVKSTTPVYCCSNAGCPSGQACVNSNGTRGQCASPGCRTDADCGTTSCTQSGTSCVSNVPKCLNGACTTSSVTSTGYCNGGRTCVSVNFCKTNCDCPQGQACRQSVPLPGVPNQGICAGSNPPTYCCDKASCPARQACTDKNGQAGFCPATCKSPCDCNAGEDCVSNKCVTGTKPVFCCDDAQKCPSGAACRDKNNVAGTCKATPRTCKTVCDCVQGEACTNGVCAATTNPVYCCDNAGCPAGKACQDKNGLTGVCRQPCTEVCDCPQGQRCLQGFCTAGSGTQYCCDKAGCPSNNFCYKKGGGTARCPAQKCTSPCDCTQGQDCRNGQCTNTFPQTYCCSNAGCPTGQACKDTSNKWGTCSGQPACTSPCDCPQGRDCFRGQCIQVSPAVYCCDNVGCPSGQICYNKSNQQSVCAGSTCTTSCDCPTQGQSCVRGRCVYSNPRIYCCSKSNCPSGNTCEDTNGKLGTCPGNACKTACDCNQGEDCRNGNCVRVSPPVYCCSKSNCRAGQACVKTDGTASTCPVQCKTRCDCPQGQDCLSGNCYTRAGAYCCSKAGCPSGQACLTTSGQQSRCGGSTGTSCKVRCDCPQGQECTNGTCVTSPFPVYCCDKTGCPSRFTCQDKTGKTGFCP